MFPISIDTIFVNGISDASLVQHTVMTTENRLPALLLRGEHKYSKTLAYENYFNSTDD